MRNASIIAAIAVVFMLWLIAAILPESVLHGALGWFYGVQTLTFIAAFLFRVRGDPYQVFRPSFLAISYLGGSISVGAALHAHGSVLQASYLANYSFWDLLPLYYLISASLSLVFLVASLTQSRRRFLRPWAATHPSWPVARMAALAVVLAVGLILGAMTEIPYTFVIRAVSAVGLMTLLFSARSPWRWPVTLLIIGLIATISYDSKREAIFLLLPALFLEFAYGSRLRMSPRAMIGGAALGIMSVYAIVAMSMMRGYGGMSPTSFFHALTLVPQYLTSRSALAMLGNNFEFTYTFQSMHDAVYSSTIAKTGGSFPGETYLRALFVGVPENLFQWRPDTIIDSYSNYSNPNARALSGASYPPTFIGEAFWNFRIFGLLAVPLVAFLMDQIYRFLMNIYQDARSWTTMTACMVVFHYVLIFQRGSGLDIWVAYTIATIISVVAIIGPLDLVFGGLAGKRRLVVRTPAPQL